MLRAAFTQRLRISERPSFLPARTLQEVSSPQPEVWTGPSEALMNPRGCDPRQQRRGNSLAPCSFAML